MLGLGDKDDDGNEASSGEPAPATALPDGTHEVVVLGERTGEKDGKQWQKVATSMGQAWNNDINAALLEKGKKYSVIVRNGSIMQAREVK